MNPISTDSGLVSGTVIGDADKSVHIFRGIPYAAPPVGNLRWKPPQAPAPWSGIRECTVFSKIAAQMDTPLVEGFHRSEDCLYLNVITPATDPDERLPVMVFMHGGGFGAGHGNDYLYNNHRLPSNGVIQVTVNMRLEVLGLMVHPLLTQESEQGVSGNYMFLDMIAALKWIRKNIAAFGGDPDRVTIFGESGGGGKVATLMASPLAAGLFHRAILQSSWNPPLGRVNGNTLADLSAIGKQLFDRLGLNREADPLKAARQMLVDKIIRANLDICVAERKYLGVWDSAIDGWFLPEDQVAVFRSGKQHPVPFIVGGNLGEIEGDGFVLPHMLPFYQAMFSGAEKAGANGYAYIFNRVPEGRRNNWSKGTPHAMEMQYVFGDYDDISGWWHMPSPDDPPTAILPDPQLNEQDRNISEAVMAMWARFAATGDPNPADRAHWPAYDSESDSYLYIGDSLEIKSGFSKIKPSRSEGTVFPFG